MRAAAPLVPQRYPQIRCRSDQIRCVATRRRKRRRSTESADLFLGHHPLELFGLALDTIAPTPVRLDRQPTDDGINTALLDDGTALRSLNLMQNVIVYGENV